MIPIGTKNRVVLGDVLNVKNIVVDQLASNEYLVTLNGQSFVVEYYHKNDTTYNVCAIDQKTRVPLFAILDPSTGSIVDIDSNMGISCIDQPQASLFILRPKYYNVWSRVFNIVFPLIAASVVLLRDKMEIVFVVRSVHKVIHDMNAVVLATNFVYQIPWLYRLECPACHTLDVSTPWLKHNLQMVLDKLSCDIRVDKVTQLGLPLITFESRLLTGHRGAMDFIQNMFMECQLLLSLSILGRKGPISKRRALYLSSLFPTEETGEPHQMTSIHFHAPILQSCHESIMLQHWSRGIRDLADPVIIDMLSKMDKSVIQRYEISCSTMTLHDDDNTTLSEPYNDDDDDDEDMDDRDTTSSDIEHRQAQDNVIVVPYPMSRGSPVDIKYTSEYWIKGDAYLALKNTLDVYSLYLFKCCKCILMSYDPTLISIFLWVITFASSVSTNLPDMFRDLGYFTISPVHAQDELINWIISSVNCDETRPISADMNKRSVRTQLNSILIQLEQGTWASQVLHAVFANHPIINAKDRLLIIISVTDYLIHQCQLNCTNLCTIDIRPDAVDFKNIKYTTSQFTSPLTFRDITVMERILIGNDQVSIVSCDLPTDRTIAQEFIQVMTRVQSLLRTSFSFTQ